MRLRLLAGALVLSLIVAVLEQWALQDYLYWRYEWFDMVMHFLGGLAVGMLLVSLSYVHRPITYIVVLAGVAVGWEVFEFFFGFPREAHFFADTALDLVMDAVGGATAYVCGRMTIWRSV